jgi:hypothetical protein
LKNLQHTRELPSWYIIFIIIRSSKISI